MLHYLSINNRFFPNFDTQWIKAFKTHNYDGIIDGIEFIFDFNKQEEIDYACEIIPRFFSHKYQFGFHMTDLQNRLPKSIYDELLFFDYFAKQTKTTIKVTFHPVDTIKMTIKCIMFMLLVINAKKLDLKLCIENLNNLGNKKRLQLDSVKKILDKFDIGLTWDIGHELSMGTVTYDLDKYIHKLENIHLHDLFGNDDHYPYNCILNGRKLKEYLCINEYLGPIIYEYGYPNIPGDTLEKKMKNYIDNIRMFIRQ